LTRKVSIAVSEDEQNDPRDYEPSTLSTAVELIAANRRMTPAQWRREAIQWQLSLDGDVPRAVILLLDGDALRDAALKAAKRKGYSLSSYTALAIKTHIARDSYARDYIIDENLDLTQPPQSWSLH
jgi:hypothetical protein